MAVLMRVDEAMELCDDNATTCRGCQVCSALFCFLLLILSLCLPFFFPFLLGLLGLGSGKFRIDLTSLEGV